MTREEKEHLIATASRDSLREVVSAFAGPRNRATKLELVNIAMNVLDSRRGDEFIEALAEDCRTVSGRHSVRRSRLGN